MPKDKSIRYPYFWHRQVIEKALAANNFKLAQKHLKKLYIRAKTDNNEYGLKACERFKARIKNDFYFFKFDKLSDKAEQELKKKNYDIAIELFENARENLIKVKDLPKRHIKKNLRYINQKIAKILQRF